MDIQGYQKLSTRTFQLGRDLETDLADYTLGILTEAGEAFDVLKKHLYHGHEMDVGRFVVEAGDVLWYVCAVCSKLGIQVEPAYLFSPLREDYALADYPVRFFKDALVLHDVAIKHARSPSAQKVKTAKRFAELLILNIEIVCGRFGVSLSQALEMNVQKLRTRYPEGFSSAASIGRAV